MKKTINKNSANGYCPLDQNKLVPNSNIPQGTSNNYAVYPIPIGDISSFTITNPSTCQFLYYKGSQWINQNISEINISNLTSDLLSCEKNNQ